MSPKNIIEGIYRTASPTIALLTLFLARSQLLNKTARNLDAKILTQKILYNREIETSAPKVIQNNIGKVKNSSPKKPRV